MSMPHPNLHGAPRPITPATALASHVMDLHISIPCSLISNMGSRNLDHTLSSLRLDAVRRINTYLSLLNERIIHHSNIAHRADNGITQMEGRPRSK